MKRAPAFHFKDLEIRDVGTMECPSHLTLFERTGLMHKTFLALVDQWSPKICVLEQAFLGKNVQSALKLGQVRGAFMAAAYQKGVHVIEMTPSHIKKTITGNGRATKPDVCLALKALCGFDRGHLSFDASDALAIAICGGLSGHQALTKP